MIFEDKNKYTNCNDTKITFNIPGITNENLIRIQTSSISNVLMGILFVNELK